MRRRFGQALRIGVSNAGLALLKTSRWSGERAAVVAEHAFAPSEGAGAQQVAQGLRALLGGASWARWPVSVVVADGLARIWHVTPPPGSARLADLEAAAALRFQALYGEPAALWQIAAGWDAQRSFMAAALPRALLEAVGEAAREHRLAVVEIVPQFIAGWNRWCPKMVRGAWYGLAHDGVLTLGVTDRSGVCAVRAAPVPPNADAAWLAAHVAREALRLGVPEPEHLQLSGQVPQAWRDAAAILGDCAHGLPPAAALAATGSGA